MKKKLLPIFLFSFLTFGLITSCAPSTSNDVVTGVEIGGSANVKVGSTIKLIADVLGTDNDSVTWTSNDETIATVDSSGVVTGIARGEVEIKATSVVDPSFFATKLVNVTQELAQDLEIVVEESEYVVHLEGNNYAVALGMPFNFEVNPLPFDAALPDGISFEAITPDNFDTSSYLLDYNGEANKATFTCYSAAEGITLKVNARHTGSDLPNIIKSINVNVVDNEELDRENFLKRLNAYKEEEGKYLSSAEILETYTSNEESFTNTYVGNVYENSSYVKTTSEDNVKYTYAGIHENTNKNVTNFYSFDYSNTKEITKLYSNENKKGNENRHHYLPFSNGISTSYSITERLLNILAGEPAIHGNIVTFQNLQAYSASAYTLSDTLNTVTSTFIDSYTGGKYTLFLDVIFDQQGLLYSYDFKETLEQDGETYVYQEKLTSISYEERTSDTYENKIDINYYLLNDYKLEICNENTELYNYSDTSKYGPEETTTTNEGLVKYILPKNKALVLIIKNTGDNEHATTMIDTVVAKSSNPLIIPDPKLTSHNIFVINPYKDNKDNITIGEATLTFTSQLGVTASIVVEFTDTEINSVFTFYTPENNDFGEVFLGSESSYFFINTDPDEDIYSYYLDIVIGEEDGLELFRYEYDNKFNYPGFSYAIRGLKLGTYKFRIGVVDSYLTTDEYYTITIVEPYSANYIKEQLIDKQYRYSTGTFESILTFENETTIKMESTMLGMDTNVGRFNIEIVDGQILIPSTQTLPTNMYFEHIEEGKIYFDKEFNSLIIFMSITGETSTSAPTADTYYTGFTFNKVIDKSDIVAYVNNKTFTTSAFLKGQGTVDFALSFADGEGKLVISKETIILEVTYSYTYDVPATAFYTTNVVSTPSSSNISMDDEIYYNSYLSRFELKVYTNSSDYNKIYFEVL